ncbi:hypothetical protein [Bacillus onubensis]|uniref:ATP-dependent DNA ligase n=1 Tax=Fredinandcohnia onubensis TaxID=1571209 RepID=UPI000C0BE98F
MVPDRTGKIDFEAVMERFKSKKSLHQLQYCVFDVIYYKGEKAATSSLLDRKKLLKEIEFTLLQVIYNHFYPIFNHFNKILITLC